MPIPNRKRFPLRHAHAYGRDFANTWNVNRLLRNSFLDEVRTGTAGAGMVVLQANIENRTAGEVEVGIGNRLNNAKWGAGQWTQATTTFADDTPDAQSAAAGDFPLSASTAPPLNNDGHMIISREPFSAILYDISTAAVSGAGHVREWSAWTGAAFTTFTPLAETGAGALAGLFTALGRNEILFRPLSNWATATSTDITGLPAGSWYVVRYRCTDAPDTAAIASTLQVWNPLKVWFPHVAGSSSQELVRIEHGMALCGDGEGLVVATSAASTGNAFCAYGEDVGDVGTLGAEDGRTFRGQN